MSAGGATMATRAQTVDVSTSAGWHRSFHDGEDHRFLPRLDGRNRRGYLRNRALGTKYAETMQCVPILVARTIAVVAGQHIP